MSISTLVLIVLAIIVLVLVVIGFTGGWSNLWDRITNLGGSKENVQLATDACKIACSSSAQYDYCGKLRDINFGTDQKERNGKYNCKALESEGVGLPACEGFSGVSSCVALTPTTQNVEVACTDIGRDYTPAGASSSYVVSGQCSPAPGAAQGTRAIPIQSNENFNEYLTDLTKYPTGRTYKLAPATGSDIDKVCCLIIPPAAR